MQFADVIVDRSLHNLDRTFQYIIPERLENKAVVGALVTVPFGRGNQTISGYIIDVSEEAKFDIGKTKEIIEVAGQGVVVESHLLLLAHWIKRNYGATMNDALKTVLPVKKAVKAVVERFVVLTVPREEAAVFLETCKKKKHNAKVRLLEAMLQEEAALDYDNVIHRLNISTSTIRSLSEAGILQVQEKKQYRNPLVFSQMQRQKIALNKDQQAVVDDFCGEYGQGIRRTYLIHGITGSGKTEVYMEMIAKVLEEGKQVIMLIPEIALTYQTVQRFYKRFGDIISIMHSRLSAGERYDQYLRAKNGEIQIMIGPRSALFTPFSNLGLIIIDEEHETGYKSEMPPRYHAREVAIERARMVEASVVLGSATPSMEAYYRAMKGEYKLYKLLKRAGSGSLPKVWVTDLREEFAKRNTSIFGEQLYTLIQERLEKKEQVMLFLNRRGYAGFVSCRKCGYALSCPHCDVSLTAHKTQGKITHLVCHYCNHQITMPQTCPQCGSKYIGGFGTGTQKVEEMTKQAFPQARILRMDADTTSGKNGHEKILSAFANREADILVGTQMIVKGHDFPNVTLVGILAADLSLNGSDFRAAERTYQLLSQAAGRAGRGELAGDVVIQTYRPDHYCIKAAAEHDYESFYRQESDYRKMLQYPPVSHILAMLVSAGEEALVQSTAAKIAVLMDREGITVIGPAKAPVYKVNDIYRMQIYGKCPDRDSLVSCKDEIERISREWQEYNRVHIQADFD